MKAVLAAAGNLKLKFPDDDENVLVSSPLNDSLTIEPIDPFHDDTNFASIVIFAGQNVYE